MPGGGFRINPDAGPIYQNMTCHNMTMDAFANLLINQVSLNGVRSPVEDKTGLEGKWDFDYKTTLRIGLLSASQPTDNITIFDAIDKQLGLKLNSIQIPQDVLIIDKAEKPTPNAPGVTEALAVKIPTEFEVADIRPVEPGPGPRRVQITRGGGVNFSAMPLRSLIQSAWGIDFNQLIVPPSMEQAVQSLYSVVAKPPAAGAPAAAEGSAAGAPPVPFGSPYDNDAAWMMMRALLKDRFKLALHQEDRVLTAWKLIAVKPKAKKADPAERTKMTSGPGPDGKDPRTSMPARQALFSFQNVTMDQFAAKMQQIGTGLTTPVVNATGLEGTYDFTLNFSYPFALQNGPGRGGGEAGAAGPTATEAAEPTGAISFQDALVEQLGLKLVEDKRPVSVWVIDHVESKPTDN